MFQNVCLVWKLSPLIIVGGVFGIRNVLGGEKMRNYLAKGALNRFDILNFENIQTYILRTKRALKMK